MGGSSTADIAMAEPMVIGMARNLALPRADVVEGGDKASGVLAVVFVCGGPTQKPAPLIHPSVEAVCLARAVDDNGISFLADGWNTVAARDEDPGISAGN